MDDAFGPRFRPIGPRQLRVVALCASIAIALRTMLKWMASRRLKLSIIAYCVVAVFSFGHAASAPRVCANSGYSDDRCPAATLAVAGTFSGLFWPLYWSWTSFEEIRALGEGR